MLEGKKVLIVEDELIIAADLQGILEKHGLVVQGIASSAATALSGAELHKPDIVLMDLQLAGVLSSLGITNQIRSFCKFGIIYISGHLIDNSRQATESPGIFISKPFTEQEIISAIQVTMREGSARPENGSPNI